MFILEINGYSLLSCQDCKYDLKIMHDSTLSMQYYIRVLFRELSVLKRSYIVVAFGFLWEKEYFFEANILLSYT